MSKLRTFKCMKMFALSALFKVMNINLCLSEDPMWHCRSGSVLVQVLAWCQIGTKPLPEPILTYVDNYNLMKNLSVIGIIIPHICKQENNFHNYFAKISISQHKKFTISLWHQQYPWAALRDSVTSEGKSVAYIRAAFRQQNNKIFSKIISIKVNEKLSKLCDLSSLPVSSESAYITIIISC